MSYYDKRESRPKTPGFARGMTGLDGGADCADIAHQCEVQSAKENRPRSNQFVNVACGEIKTDRREIDLQTERLGSGISNLQSIAHELASRLVPITNPGMAENKAVGRENAPNFPKLGSVLNDMASDVEKLHAFLYQLCNSIEL